MPRHGRRRAGSPAAGPRPRRRLRLGRLVFVAGSLLALVVAGVGANMVRRAIATLPAIGDPTHHLGQSSVIYDLAGNPVAVVPGPVDRQPVSISQIPPLVQHAFIAVEDRRFYQNRGIDIRSILRAAVSDLEGHPLQGGSTISGELAKNVYLTPRDTITRKIKEAILALELNRRYTKPEILDMYLNWIYLGEHAYGIQAAAETYFGVPVGRLTLTQVALLAGLPQEPVGYDPYFHPALALQRRNTVLGMMESAGYITAKQAAEAEKAPLGVQPRQTQQDILESYPYPWFVDAVISQLENQDHLSAEQISSGGLKIYTTLVPRIYDAAQVAVSKLQQYFPLTGSNPMQAAVAVVDQSNGDVVAVIGGRQHTTMLAYDRALYAERQPGSSIKPLVDYIPALEDGLTAGTVVDDRVVSYEMGAGQPAYVPKDYQLPYYGLTTLTEALRRSVNTVAVQVLAHVGVVNGWSNAIRMGLPLTKSDRHLALALGGTTDCCTPLDMAVAYATIANGGARVTPRIITKVVAPDGSVLVNNPPQIQQVIDPRVAFVMTRMLMAVDEPQPPNGWDANWGTGYDASVQDNVPGWPTAGKTGTTNSNRDAWYVGFTPLYTAAVWLGYDTPEPFPGLYGGTYAGPIFRATMEAALQPYRPIPFRRPAGVTQAWIDTKAAPWTVAKPGPLTPPQWKRLEWFVDGTQPKSTNPLWVQEQVDSANPSVLWEPGCPGHPVAATFLNRPPLGQGWARLVAGALGGTWQDYVPSDMSMAPPTRTCLGTPAPTPAASYLHWFDGPGFGGGGGSSGEPIAPVTAAAPALVAALPPASSAHAGGGAQGTPAQTPPGGGAAAASGTAPGAASTSAGATSASTPSAPTGGAPAASGTSAGGPAGGGPGAATTGTAPAAATGASATGASGTPASGTGASGTGSGTGASGTAASGTAAPPPGTTPSGASGTGASGTASGTGASGTAASGAAATAAACQPAWHVTLSRGQPPSPAALCVPQGQTAYITLTATDGHVHDVLISGYGEEAEVPATGAPVTISFMPSSAGVFTFQDALDPAETGTLTVRAESAPGSPAGQAG